MDPIETTRLILEPWCEVDKGVFAALASHPRVMKFIGDGSTWDADRVNDVFERQRLHWQEHGFGWRSAIEKLNSDRIGFIGLNHVGPEATEITQDEVEIGWWLDPRQWGKGLATEGAIAVRDEAFERIGLQRIIGRYQPPNAASGRIMRSIGMVFEREAVGRHGELIHIYTLDRNRWAEPNTSAARKQQI